MHTVDTARLTLRQLTVALGVLLISGSAFVSIVQTPHTQPVTSSEVDGALMHLSEVVVAD